MSLSRILNDDPAPPLNSRLPAPPLSANPSPEPSFDNDLPRQQHDHHLSSSSRHPSSLYNNQDSATEPRTFHPQPGPFQSSTRDWDSYSGEWPRDQGPASHESSLYHDQQPSRYMSPDPPRPAPPVRDSEPETLSRKRRKNTNDDPSYSSVTLRRVSHIVSLLPPPCLLVLVSQGPPRKRSKRTKQMRASPDLDSASNHYDVQPGLADEDGLPISSDLEDCEDLWKSELDEYTIYTKKRQQQIEKWFEASVIVSFCCYFLHSYLIKVSGAKWYGCTTSFASLCWSDCQYSIASTFPSSKNSYNTERRHSWRSVPS